MRACDTYAAGAPYGVELIDEDDTRRFLHGLLEQVAYTRRADAHEHLDELGTAHGEEGNLGLARNSPGQKRLACAGRSHKQHALGDATPELGKFVRVLEKLNYFHELFLRFLYAGHIMKRHFHITFAIDLGTRLPEAHECFTSAARTHSPEDKTPDDHENDKGKDPGEQEIPDPIGGSLAPKCNAGCHEIFNQIGVINPCPHDREWLFLFACRFRDEYSGDAVSCDHEVLDPLLRHEQFKIAVWDGFCLRFGK